MRAFLKTDTQVVYGALSMRKRMTIPAFAAFTSWSCASTPAPAEVRYDTVRITTRDTLYVTRVDTIRLASPPAGGGAGGAGVTQAQLRELSLQRDNALRMATARQRDLMAARLRMEDAERNLAIAAAEVERVNASASDSLRIEGTTEMTVGEQYPFTVWIAKRISLPPFRPGNGKVITAEPIPAVGDSAMICITGEGFRFLRAGVPSASPDSMVNRSCAVRSFGSVDSARRQWKWIVTPDSLDVGQGSFYSDRQITIVTQLFEDGAEDSPVLTHKVRVHVRNAGLFERLIWWLKTAQGMFSALAATVTAAFGVWIAYRKGKAAA